MTVFGREHSTQLIKAMERQTKKDNTILPWYRKRAIVPGWLWWALVVGAFINLCLRTAGLL